MHIKTLFSPFTVLDRLRFLARCVRNRGFVEWFLDDPEFPRRLYYSGPNLKAYVQWLAGEERLVEELYHGRHQLKDYFLCRWELSRMTFEEATIFPEEQLLLRRLVEASNSLPGPIIEIGTLFGSTTTLLAMWKSPRKKIVTVDNYSWNPWQVSAVVHRNLTAQVLRYLSATGTVDIICQDKQTFYDSYRGEPPALVFLDADHSYEGTKADIQWAKQIGAAIICGHDFASHCPGVCRAVEEEGGTEYHSHTVWALKTPYLQRSSERNLAA
jgi:hypothetical protein